MQTVITAEEIQADLSEHGIDPAEATIKDGLTGKGNGAVTVKIGNREARFHAPNSTWSLKVSGRYANDAEYESAGSALSADLGTEEQEQQPATNGTVEQEQTVETPEPRLCTCGCGEAVTGKKARFLTGHDAKLKGRLLAAFDAGDETAGATLVANGWKSAADLAARQQDAATRQATSAGTKRERLVARIARAKAEVERLEAELAALAG